jgi:transposase-like protein
MDRRRWTADDARAALADQEASGLALSAFALEMGLEPQRLLHWRRVLAPTKDAAFEEVVRRPTVRGTRGDVVAGVAQGCCEVVLASGRVVRVPESFNAEALARLLAVVEEVGVC